MSTHHCVTCNVGQVHQVPCLHHTLVSVDCQILDIFLLALVYLPYKRKFLSNHNKVNQIQVFSGLLMILDKFNYAILFEINQEQQTLKL